MIEVKITKIPKRITSNDDNTQQKTNETDVKIVVLMNIPQLDINTNIGFMFEEAPQVILAEEVISFQDMSKLMKKHNAKSWTDVRNILHDMYKKYFERQFQDFSKFNNHKK